MEKWNIGDGPQNERFPEKRTSADLSSENYALRYCNGKKSQAYIVSHPDTH